MMWRASTFRYKRNDGEVDGARQGLCCVVSAVPGALQEDDLECSENDEDKPEETTATAATSDKPASSVIHITSRTGRKDLEVCDILNQLFKRSLS